MPPKFIPAPDRFWPKINRDGPNGCWLWTGARDPFGYGNFYNDGQYWRAHRFSYTLLVGAIPSELELDHLCRVTSCVNPDHLEPVTGRVNKMRGTSPFARKAVQTHCMRGHGFSPENTYIKRSAYGIRRNCRTCELARHRRDQEVII